MSPRFQSYLGPLLEYEIVILADDSGSMSMTAYPNPTTRWQELKGTLSQVVKVGTLFDHSGVDLYFLNRPGMKNLTSPAQLDQFFESGPSGGTPLVRGMEAVFNEYRNDDSNVLLLIITDGVPNGGMVALKNLLRKRENDEVLKNKFAISFLMATEDDSVVEGYNSVDNGFHGIDVSDDYLSEKKEVNSAYPGRTFSVGDWLAKILLGPINREVDNIDTKPPGGCCTIL